MQSFQSVIERMGTNFLVAAFIPSLAFVTSGMVLFRPVIPELLYNELIGTANPLLQGALILLLLSIILGFTLTSLNIFILKVFEGYILLRRLPHFHRSELRRLRKLNRDRQMIKQEIKMLEKRIHNLPETHQNKVLSKRLENLQNRDYRLALKNDLEFPPVSSDILPTRFGNILKAAESYPGTRYGIDAVPMWPRLVHVIPASYYEKIDQSHDQVSFLANCAVLSIGFSCLSLIVAIYQAFLGYCRSTGIENLTHLVKIEENASLYVERSWLYLICVAIGLVAARIFQRASLVSVTDYGYMIRSAYDLFRFDLLKQLRQELPKDTEEEEDKWRSLSEFMNLGKDQTEVRLRFEYQSDMEAGAKS